MVGVGGCSGMWSVEAAVRVSHHFLYCGEVWASQSGGYSIRCQQSFCLPRLQVLWERPFYMFFLEG